ncbi:flavin reductase family protein [Streptomyces sp. NPDC051665]|uniref:flavin reductase family protein n=1 Tax=Streptomyces sp. NPDC051665 TaxID=3154647 RepID=UPI00341A57F2
MITVKDLQPHPLDQVHRLIEPGPVILVTTRHRGVPNVMTNGFNMMVRPAPPLIACTIGPWDHSYEALVETGECVVSVPTADMAATVVDIGNCSGADVDKFEEFALTAVDGEKVQAPLVAECFADIECRVADTSLVAPTACSSWSRSGPGPIHRSPPRACSTTAATAPSRSTARPSISRTA